MTINVEAVEFKADVKLEELIQKKVGKLETFFDKIIDAEVHLRLENKNTQVKDKMVNITLRVPGQSLIAKGTSKTFEESLEMAVESSRRQLEKYKEKLRD